MRWGQDLLHPHPLLAARSCPGKLWVGLLWLAWIALAPGHAAPDEGFRVGGLVKQAGGHPVAGAEIWLGPVPSPYEQGLALLGLDETRHRAGQWTATTDASGYFEFTKIPRGLWRVQVRATGLVPMEQAAVAVVEDLQLPTVQLLDDRGLRLTVRGRGEEALWTGIQARAETLSPALWRAALRDDWRPLPRWALADDRGTVYLARAEEESLRFLAFAPGFLEDGGSTGGGEVQRSIHLQPSERWPVRVMGADGPIANAVVRIGRGYWPEGLSDEAGWCQVTAPGAGDLTVQVWTEDGASAIQRLAASTLPRTVLQGPTLKRAAGHVRQQETGRPLSGALVWIRSRPFGFGVSDAESGVFLAFGPTDEKAPLGAVAPGYMAAAIPAEDWHGGSFQLPLAADGRLSGVVVNATGQPITAAELWIVKREPGEETQAVQVRSRTFSTGDFLVPELEPGGRYRVIARKEGHAPAVVDAQASPQSTVPMRLVLAAGVEVFGRIVDEDDEPVSGARTVLDDNSLEDADRAAEAVLGAAATLSGTDGLFHLEDLKPGSYALVVHREGYAPTWVAGVELRGTESAFDFGKITLRAGVAIEGIVVDPEGNPVNEVRVALGTTGEGSSGLARRFAGGGIPTGTTDRTGRFRITGLLEGERLPLRLQKEGYADAAVPVVRAPTQEPLRVVLSPTVTLRGRVVSAGSGPVPGSILHILEQRGEVAIPGGRRYLETSRRAISTDAEGRFALSDVTPGIVTLRASAPGFSPTRLPPLHLDPGEVREDLALILLPGATILGIVADQDGNPIPGVHVEVAFPEPEISRDRLYADTTDDLGRFQIPGVPKGSVSLLATHERFQQHRESFTVEEDAAEIHLVLDQGFDLEGRVLNSDGSSVAGIDLQLDALTTSSPPRRTRSTDGGRFAFQGLAPGTFRLVAQGSAGESGEERLAIQQESVEGLEIRLQSVGSLWGHLVGPGTQELAAMEIRAQREGFLTRFGEINLSGEFGFDALAAGRWDVVAYSPTSGRRARESVVIEPGTPKARVDLDFDRNFVLKGQLIVNGAPVGGARIAVRPEAGAPISRAITQRDGLFEIPDQQSGPITLEVLLPESGLLVREAKEIEPGGVVVLDLWPVALTVRVGTAEGVSIPGARVTLQPAGIDPLVDQVQVARTTNEGGIAHFARVAPGRYLVVIQGAGFASRQRDLDLMPNEEPETLDVILEPVSPL